MQFSKGFSIVNDNLFLINHACITSCNASGGIKPDREPTIGISNHAARRLAIIG